MYTSNEMSNCYATGNVNGFTYVGGLVGEIDGSDIIESYATGNVSGQSLDVGGLVGFLHTSNGSFESSIVRSFSTGNVSGDGSTNSVGGFIGRSYKNPLNITISNCYATGNISNASNKVGGFIGEVRNGADIENCYSVGTVVGSGTNVGGFIGEFDPGTLTANYWKTDLGALLDIGDDGDVSQVVETPDADMKIQGTYSGWDFTTTPIWKFVSGENNDYPVLNWQIFLPTVTTAAIENIDITAADGGGEVTSDGGGTISARGVVVSTTSNPTISSNDVITDDGTSVGAFTSNITGLDPLQLYYVRAYATNEVGTAYGSEITFTTIPTLGEWGLIALGSLMAIFGGWFVYRKFV